MTQPSNVLHNAPAARFEMSVADQLCIAQYHLVDGVMWLTHTEVPPPLQSRGLAAQLVGAALDHARAHGLKVKPACSYVRSYMRRHPDTQDLLESPSSSAGPAQAANAASGVSSRRERGGTP